MKGSLVASMLVCAVACGGGSGGEDPDGNSSVLHDCEQGGRATSDSYLPFEVGNTWRYRVIDPTGQKDPEIKRQEYIREFVPEGESEPVIHQRTIKAKGSTESWFRREGYVTKRLREMDITPENLLKQTTVFEPYRLRIDESPERLVQGASWQNEILEIIHDPAGTETERVTVIDEWTVIGVDVACETPFAALECLHLRRERLEGGIGTKDFYFARGYGKVREDGGQIEELIGCLLN